MAVSGLPQNFQMKETNINNAAAAIITNSAHIQERWILYNQNFLSDVEKRTQSKNSFLVILAHEIGHHLAGHTLLSTGSQPDLEIEADRFAGFISRRLNISLDEALLPIQIYASDVISKTHPNRSARLIAIKNGWEDADLNSETRERRNSYEIGNRRISVEYDNKVGNNEPVSHYDFISNAAPVGISFRNKNLSDNDIKLVNSGNSEAKAMFNAVTLYRFLPPGTKVKVIKDMGKSLQIIADVNGLQKTGFIVKEYKGMPTVGSIPFYTKPRFRKLVKYFLVFFILITPVAITVLYLVKRKPRLISG